MRLPGRRRPVAGPQERDSGTPSEGSMAGAPHRAAMRWDGLLLHTHHDVYEPAEDSFLLADAARREARARRAGRALDVGTGTGLAALAMAREGLRVVATDANPAATELARANAHANHLDIEIVRGDLATALRGPFDLVTMNPPYLPPEPDAAAGHYERALTGGPTGAETALRLLDDLPRLLAPDGAALLLTSTRGNETAVLDAAVRGGLAPVPLGEERFFFERLTAWKLERGR